MTTSYTYTHTVEADVIPEAIWGLYEDVTTWPSWDAQAERITRNGPFETGTTGTMKFLGQEPLSYRLAKVEPLREFVDETPVGSLLVRVSHLLSSLLVRVSHLLSSLPDGHLRITYSAEIDGPADAAQQIGPMITADFPETMGSLVALAKKRSS